MSWQRNSEVMLLHVNNCFCHTGGKQRQQKNKKCNYFKIKWLDDGEGMYFLSTIKVSVTPIAERSGSPTGLLLIRSISSISPPWLETSAIASWVREEALVARMSHLGHGWEEYLANWWRVIAWHTYVASNHPDPWHAHQRHASRSQSRLLAHKLCLGKRSTFAPWHVSAENRNERLWTLSMWMVWELTWAS